MVKKRRLFLIGGIIGIVVLLMAIGWFSVAGLRDSADSTIDRLVAQLPGAGRANRENDDEADQSTSARSQPFAPSPSPEIPVRSLAVTVKYQRDPGFTLRVDDVRHTTEQSTIQHYKPAPGAPYSIIRILDEQGRTITEAQFTVTTAGIFEGPDIVPQVINLEESTAYIVLPIPVSSTPATVQLTTPSSVIFDEAPVPQQTVLEYFKDLFNVRVVRAQGSAQKFTIVFISDAGVNQDDVQRAIGQARGILSIEPWATFADQVEMVPLINSLNLGCIGGPGNSFTCANDAFAMQLASQRVPGWDAIVIVTSVPCDCGFVGTGLPPITAVGRAASVRTIVHELGHSIGKMVDEYGYTQGGFTISPGAPNCFDSRSDCLAGLQQYQVQGQSGAECSLGCDGVTRWRPATRIMHNTYSPLQFGPLEECLMGNKIAQAIGENYECDEDAPSPTPLPSTKPYWGWIAP